MGFNTALSGIKASADYLGVTGNNIANADTTGFKKSRIEFGDLYNNSVLGAGSSNTIGSGVSVNNVAQQFSPGNIAYTNNNLDLAVDGAGFFVLEEGGTQYFTRAGDFKLDEDGFLVTNDGANVQGYNAVEGIVGGNLENLTVPTERIAPQATETIGVEVNLDSRNEDVPAFIDTAFDPADPTTYNYTQTQNFTDGGGGLHIISYYYSKSELPNTYQVHVTVDGNQYDNSGNSWLSDWYVTFNNAEGRDVDGDGTINNDPTAGSGEAPFELLYSGSGTPTETDIAGLSLTNITINSSTATTPPVVINTTGSPLTTAAIELPSNVARKAFDPSLPSTYTYGNTKTIYDTLGESHTVGYYFIQQGEDNTYEMRVTVDGKQTYVDNNGDEQRFIPENTVVTFDTSGNYSGLYTGYPPFATRSPLQLEITGFDPTDRTATIPVDLAGSTQYALSSSDVFSQDGFAAGELQGVSFDEDGYLIATYTNQQTSVLGQIALATFDNTDGLSPAGDTSWVASSNSGPANIGKANTGTLGSIKGGALEESNVDLTSELVALIEAQRNYQANSKTLETENTVTQTILNLR